jgi:KaiC/GvpD/RAD55 family RecA-like ATPase
MSNYRDDIIRAINEYGTDDPNVAALMHNIRHIVDEYEIEHNGAGEASKLGCLKKKLDISGPFDYVEEYEELYTSTGFKTIDEAIVGWRRGKLHLIDSPLGFGKSRFLLNAALNVSLHEPVMYYSFSSSKETVSDFMLRSIAARNNVELPRGKHYEPHVEVALDEIRLKYGKAYSLFLKDRNPYSISSLINDMTTSCFDNKCKWIFIDNIENIISTRHPSQQKYFLRALYQALSEFAKSDNVGIIFTRQFQFDNYAHEKHKRWVKQFDNRSYEKSHIDIILFLTAKRYFGYAEEGDLHKLTYVNLVQHYGHAKYMFLPIFDDPAKSYMRDLNDTDLVPEVVKLVFEFSGRLDFLHHVYKLATREDEEPPF